MNKFYLGLMSGTSVDSIDAALISSAETSDKLLLHCEFPWKKSTRTKILDLVHTPQTSLEKILALHYEIGSSFAEAAAETIQHAKAKKLLSAKNFLTAIGCHGQTIFHDPAHKRTWQLGEASLIAARTGITTISDFRTADTAAGGEGAPLVPYYHQRLLPKPGSVFLNLGGIANYTYIGKNHLLALDTGPANCWMDYVIHSRTGKDYDRDGILAATGEVQERFLSACKNFPEIKKFRARAAPKSTGRELFSATTLEKILKRFPKISTPDLMRTLLQFSVDLIHDSVETEILNEKKAVHTIIVAGGGVHNPLFLHLLQVSLPMVEVHKSLALNLNCKALEAQAFAYFAHASLEGIPITFPTTTGCKTPAICGKISPGANWQKTLHALTK